ncbi:MAG: SUMF1/EgtB/PvdO family nonheme iron enzyme [Proteobacteria bacterium]|nr:SUMF1/EgtB/PvdO family nonheme iron enzyme [Pseudomonadota bacterium]
MKKTVFTAFVNLIVFYFTVFACEKTSNINQKNPKGIVLVPGGIFQMGIDKEDIADLVIMGKNVAHMDSMHALWWFGDETPKHTVKAVSFYMDEHEVTNKEFAEFVAKTSYKA